MICISLMANNVEHNFMCLLAIYLSLEPIFKNWLSTVDHPSLKKRKIVSHLSRLIQKANLAQSVLNISLLVEWHSTQLKEKHCHQSTWSVRELALSLQMAVLSPRTPVHCNRKSIPWEQHRNPWQEGTCLHCPFKTYRQGLPWWLSSKEFCQCRRQQFVRSLIQ